jgi:hypothetical protein
MAHAGIAGGPLFRAINRHVQVQESRLSGIDAARVVKKLALRAGLDAAKYAGHSLRAGTEPSKWSDAISGMGAYFAITARASWDYKISKTLIAPSRRGGTSGYQ